jgi:hypothetical protein
VISPTFYGYTKGACVYTILAGASMDEDREQNQDLEIESLTEEEYALEQKVIPFMCKYQL